MGGGGSREYDDLADGAALGDGVEGEVRLREGEPLAHERPDPALAGPSGQDGELAGGLGGLAAGEVAPEHADDLAALEEREVERDAGDLARREADDQVPPAPRDAAQRRLGNGAADRVEDDVHAVRVPLLEERLEVAGGVVDELVRPLRLRGCARARQKGLAQQQPQHGASHVQRAICTSSCERSKRSAVEMCLRHTSIAENARVLLPI